MALDAGSGDKKVEYKFSLFIELICTWHCISKIHSSFHVDSHYQGLIFESTDYVGFYNCSSFVLRCTIGTFLLLFNFYIDFLKSAFERITPHQPH